MRSRLLLTALLAALPSAAAAAQQPLTRADAISQALAHGPELGVLRADTAAAAAQMITARALPNPLLSAIYSKDTPHYHVTAEFPLDFLWLRDGRVLSADAARRAAEFRFDYGRAAVALGADTAYTRILAAQAHAQLSVRNLAATDSLRRIAEARRAAGDASDLEVELATVAAGQQANVAAADSLTLAGALLDLQALLGLPADRIAITPVDSLLPPRTATAAPSSGSATLPVAGATAELESATLGARVQHKSLLASTGLMFGVEGGDPGGQSGLLPTFGISVPLPFLNRNRGPIAEAEAAMRRAGAELELARVESGTAIAQAERAETAALARINRDQLLSASANRIAAMSITAYREGAAPLANVIEAERTAREVQGQYIDDVASALIAAATLRLLTLTPGSTVIP